MRSQKLRQLLKENPSYFLAPANDVAEDELAGPEVDQPQNQSASQSSQKPVQDAQAQGEKTGAAAPMRDNLPQVKPLVPVTPSLAQQAATVLQPQVPRRAPAIRVGNDPLDLQVQELRKTLATVQLVPVNTSTTDTPSSGAVVEGKSSTGKDELPVKPANKQKPQAEHTEQKEKQQQQQQQQQQPQKQPTQPKQDQSRGQSQTRNSKGQNQGQKRQPKEQAAETSQTGETSQPQQQRQQDQSKAPQQRQGTYAKAVGKKHQEQAEHDRKTAPSATKPAPPIEGQKATETKAPPRSRRDYAHAAATGATTGYAPPPPPKVAPNQSTTGSSSGSSKISALRSLLSNDELKSKLFEEAFRVNQHVLASVAQDKEAEKAGLVPPSTYRVTVETGTLTPAYARAQLEARRAEEARIRALEEEQLQRARAEYAAMAAAKIAADEKRREEERARLMEIETARLVRQLSGENPDDLEPWKRLGDKKAREKLREKLQGEATSTASTGASATSPGSGQRKQQAIRSSAGTRFDALFDDGDEE